MKKSVLLLIILFFVDIAASAQLVKSRIGGNSQHQLTFSAGVNYPSFDINRNIGPIIGLSYTYFFIPQLGARVIGNYHYFDGTTNAIPYYSHNAELEIEGVYNFFNNQSRRKENSGLSLLPSQAYLFLGFGGLFCVPHVGKFYINNIPTLTIPIGIGTQHEISKNWNIGLEFAWHLTLIDNLDNKIIDGSSLDSYPTLCLTGTYKIPKFGNTSSRSKQFQHHKKQKCDPRKGCAVAFD